MQRRVESSSAPTTEPAASSGKSYVVKAGDNPFRIAKRFGAAVHVGLDQYRYFGTLALGHLAEHVLELRCLLLGKFGFA